VTGLFAFYQKLKKKRASEAFKSFRLAEVFLNDLKALTGLI
jgi:hypothetical protein